MLGRSILEEIGRVASEGLNLGRTRLAWFDVGDSLSSAIRWVAGLAALSSQRGLGVGLLDDEWVVGCTDDGNSLLVREAPKQGGNGPRV